MIPRRFFWIFDLLVIILAFMVSGLVTPHFQRLLASKGILQSAWLSVFSPEPEYTAGRIMQNLWIILVASLPMVIFLDIDGAGKWVFQSLTRIILAGPSASLVGISVVSLVPFSLRNPPIRLSRSLLFSFGIICALALSAYRYALRGYFRRRREAGYYVRNVLLVGLRSSIARMTRYFEENVNSNEYKIFGSLEVEQYNTAYATGAGGNRLQNSVNPNILGGVNNLDDLLISKPIHEVVAIQPTSGGEWISQVIQDCNNLGILLRIIPEPLITGLPLRLQTLFPFQPLHLPAVVLAPPHLDSDAIFAKRIIDAAASALLLVLLSPLFLLVALAIKIWTPELPVFYRWRVVGRNGVEFTGYKFTTMCADADQRKQELLDCNEMTGPVFKVKDDPRMTTLGRFLRKFSINELPQLWSVFKGDMSLVGPRPAFRHELERYEFWHKRKLSIRPGITCLWQIRGRNKIHKFDDWVRMDLEYIDNWSLWLDLKILIRTVWVVLAGTGS
jgi:exopolysaccharide biosynthesis polyprenyl glycosylphosphotransferase